MRPLDRGFLYTACWTLALVLPASILAQKRRGTSLRVMHKLFEPLSLSFPTVREASKGQGASAPQQSSSSSVGCPGFGADRNCANSAGSRSGSKASAARRYRGGRSSKSEGGDCGSAFRNCHCSSQATSCKDDRNQNGCGPGGRRRHRHGDRPDSRHREQTTRSTLRKFQLRLSRRANSSCD